MSNSENRQVSTDENHVRTGCEWEADEENNWTTSCGKTFCLIEGGPIENDMKFCCYCGLALDELPYEEPDYDESDELDGECFRGGEAAGAMAESQAWIQRNLK